MKKIVIKKLADASFTKNTLDKEKVDRIAKKLNRGDLKEYIKDLKNLNSKKTVIVSLPSENGASKIRDMFAKIYPARRIEIKIDEDLISGIKVIDYDNEYELSMKSFLEESMEYLRKND